MNWPVILNISAIVLGGSAAAFTHYDKKRIAIILTLCVSVINGVAVFVKKKEYSSEVPAITASPFGRVVRIIAVNPDNELPIKDASAKLQGYPSIQLGTMYPRVINVIKDLCVANSTTIVVSVWYNETERFEADFSVKMKPDSSLTVETSYFDAKGAPFVPPWKVRALKSGPDTTSHYNPTLFK